jgi:hypothetical protein
MPSPAVVASFGKSHNLVISPCDLGNGLRRRQQRRILNFTVA